MYNGLGGVNCIYDDGTVIPLGQGPCQNVLDNGAYLVDANVSETEITVTTTPPFSWMPIALGLTAFLLFSGRRKRVR